MDRDLAPPPAAASTRTLTLAPTAAPTSDPAAGAAADPGSDSASGSADAAEPPGPGAAHRTSISESGSFTTARCSCGWSAPARRSRDKSRRDATSHTD